MVEPPANLEELVRKIASDIGASEAAAFAVERDFFDGNRINPLLHVRLHEADNAAHSAALAAFQELVSTCVQTAKDGAIEIDATENGHGKQFCLVTLARRDTKVTGAAAFIVRCRDEQDAGNVLIRIQRCANGGAE